jgi:hypothetical protein
MKLERKLFSGVMNLDDPNEVIPGASHRDASNVLFKGNPGQMRLESVPGNQSVANAGLYTTGGATNTCIGSYYDELKQRVFYFVYNSAGRDAIFVYNTNTRAITTLLMSKVDSQLDEDLFSFNPDYPIVSVNILYRTEADGDILYWTDRNQRPMKLNIKEAENDLYGEYWKKSYLTVARKMPLISPLCKYNDDASVMMNNLKNRVFQFSYRWVYSDDTKSTFSPWSRLFAPVNVDTLATEISPNKNNKIEVLYNTGDADVKKIEIVARQSISTTFSDSFLVKTIDKATETLSNDSDYTYNYYNSESYPFVDASESNLLFSYVPKKANSQELLNGNVVIYGGITEGVTNSITPLVATTLDLVTNTSTGIPFVAYPYNYIVTDDTIAPYPNYVSGSYYWVFTGNPTSGDIYQMTLSIRKWDSIGLTVLTANVTKTLTVTTQNLSQVRDYFITEFSTDATMVSYGLDSTKIVIIPVADPNFPSAIGMMMSGNNSFASWVTSATSSITLSSTGLPSDPTGVNTACYKHQSRYSFGICYFDEFGVTNGVTTTDSMNVITSEINDTNVGTSSQLKIPSIQFDITSQAPSWAKYFSFVRTANLTIQNFKTIITNRTHKDTGPTYAYLDISKYQTNKSNWEAYSFNKGDRIRIIAKKGLASSVKDFPVLSYQTSAELLPTVPTIPSDGIWLKVQYDSSMSTFGTDNEWYVEVYTPALNTISSNTQIYYEFGETYNVIKDGANYYHQGQLRDQTASQSARYKFVRGDIYSRLRNPLDIAGSQFWILDRSMSDLFLSKVSGNGRPFVQDEYAKETYYPTLVRYSLDYQSGTSINKTNIFYAANFDEYDREKGDIQRLKTRGRQMRVFQNRACGVVPILQNVVQTVDGNGILSQSAEIINKIQYYLGEYGLGYQYSSLACSASADYFSDPVRGCQVRLSGDGITPISEIYKAHFYLNPLLVKYNKTRNNITGIGKAKILAFYDQFNEEYVSVMQESTGTLPDKTSPITLGFNEFRNSYTSFYNYSPEHISTASNLVISWKSGVLYTHDNTTNYCNFYGVQYKPSVTYIFNQYEQVKKRYNTITMLANKVWAPNTNGDISTNLGQNSSLQSTDFIFKDDKIHASFKRDSGSTGGLYNGNVLKGNWAQIKLQPVNGNEFVNLYYIELSILEPFYNR